MSQLSWSRPDLLQLCLPVKTEFQPQVRRDADFLTVTEDYVI